MKYYVGGRRNREGAATRAGPSPEPTDRALGPPIEHGLSGGLNSFHKHVALTAAWNTHLSKRILWPTIPIQYIGN
jgi:hypothetical protein